MVPILAGIFLGACLFAATLSSLARAMSEGGTRRKVHVAILVLVVLGAATVSLAWAALAGITGVLLVVAGAAGVVVETGLHRVLPVVPILFGIALMVGLPFAG